MKASSCEPRSAGSGSPLFGHLAAPLAASLGMETEGLVLALECHSAAPIPVTTASSFPSLTQRGHLQVGVRLQPADTR